MFELEKCWPVRKIVLCNAISKLENLELEPVFDLNMKKRTEKINLKAENNPR